MVGSSPINPMPSEHMDKHNHTSPDSQADNIDLYALGMLSAAERAEFETAIRAGEIDANDLDESLQTITGLSEEIAAAMPTPRKAVKDALMSAITGQPAAPAESVTKEQMFLYANDGEWQELFPGIRIRVLHYNEADGRTMFLARLGPGSAYPAHRHKGLEECLVLEGDLHVDGRVLRAGDFTAAYDENVHIDTHSEEGCLLLLTSPLNDEMLGDDHA